MSTTGEDFNASNLTGIFAGDDRSLALSVMVFDDDIDEEDEVFAASLELVSAMNPRRVDLSERCFSLFRINDDDGECECVCVFADCSELMYVECIISVLVIFLPTSPNFLFLLPFHFYPYSLSRHCFIF